MKGDQKVVKDFKYKERRCVVIEINRDYLNVSEKLTMGVLKGMNLSIDKPYCCGYIEIKDNEVKESYDDYSITSDELTFQGELKFGDPDDPHLDISDGKTYIGFDSAHSWNDTIPESKTASYVENTCKKIVDEIRKWRKK